MNRRLMSLLVVVLFAAGCSDDSTSDDDPASTETSAGGESVDDSGEDPDAVVELPDEAELSAGLLTVSDMPTGWAVMPDDGDDDPVCDLRIHELLGLEDELPNAEAQFAEDEDTGPLISHSVGFVPTGRGPEAIDALAAALDACEGDSAEDFDVSVSELSFPSLGDESIAYRFHFKNEEANFDADAVYSRTGDLIVIVAALAVFGNPAELLEEYAPLAVERSTSALL